MNGPVRLPKIVSLFYRATQWPSLASDVKQTMRKNQFLLCYRSNSSTLSMISQLAIFQLMFAVCFSSNDMRSMHMSKIGDSRYECTDPGCLSSTTVPVSNLHYCQIACLDDLYCRTVTYDPFINSCEVFFDRPDEHGSMLAEAGVTTWIVTDYRPRKIGTYT